MQFPVSIGHGPMLILRPDFNALRRSSPDRVSSLGVMVGIFMGAFLAQPGLPQQNPPDLRVFLPAAGVVKQELSLDFENDGVGEIALVYTLPDESDDVYHTTMVQVLKYSPISGWAVAFQETESKMTTGDHLAIERLTSLTGNEGVVVISYHSGAGTATWWHVLASVRNKISRLDPTRVRTKVLKERGYMDWGYNGVRSKGDLVVEDLPGYSPHTSRCCPDRPSIDIRFRFTGSSIRLDSVKELPFSPTKY